MANDQASFIWYELMTTDTDAAQAFYRTVVGWNARRFEGGMDYTILSAGERGVAGMMKLSTDASAAGARPNWIGYVAVPNVDAAAAKLRAAGGTVHRPPEDIPGVGRFAPVSDPQGAAFILFTPKPTETPPPAADPMSPGQIAWHELYTADWQAAFGFYSGQFGWAKGDALDMGPMGTYQLFSAGSSVMGGMMNNPIPNATPAWLYYFNVPEIDAAVARVTVSGGKVLNGPQEVPGGGWIIQAEDPQRAMFALFAPRR